MIWFFVDCADFGDVLFRNYNKVDLKVYRPAEGILIRLSCPTVRRCQSLLGEFTRTRPFRKSCDVARPVYSHSIDGSGTVRCALHDMEVARAITYQYVKLGLPHHISAQSHQHAVGPRCQASNVQP